MAFWILPWNSKKFNLTGCLIKANGIVDWRQYNNFKVGDFTFMYCSLPIGRITHLFEVIDVNVSHDKISDDREFYLEGTDWNDKVPPKGYVRLKLVSIANITEVLTFKSLVKAGMPKNVQSAIKVKEGLLQQIISGFDLDTVEPGNKMFIEGTSHSVIQTYYERDPQARLACLAHYGNRYNCEICGFNFKSLYGEVGKGFIHVHHINFLSDNKGKPTQTNPKEDLIPVCPNCHAMLHRKLDGSFITPTQLREKFSK